MAVSAVYLPHMRDPEANSINVWVVAALPGDSVLCFMPVRLYGQFVNDAFGNNLCQFRF